MLCARIKCIKEIIVVSSAGAKENCSKVALCFRKAFVHSVSFTDLNINYIAHLTTKIHLKGVLFLAKSVSALECSEATLLYN